MRAYPGLILPAMENINHNINNQNNYFKMDRASVSLRTPNAVNVPLFRYKPPTGLQTPSNDIKFGNTEKKLEGNLMINALRMDSSENFIIQSGKAINKDSTLKLAPAPITPI